MANRLYPKAKENLLQAKIDLVSGTVKATLVDTTVYTYSATHETISDVPAGARIATIELASGKSVTNGVFDAADVIFSTVSGSAAQAMVIWIDGTTDYLVAYLDSVTGLPVTPNGGDIELAWDSGASKIFAL